MNGLLMQPILFVIKMLTENTKKFSLYIIIITEKYMKILQKIESWFGNSTWFTTKLENLKTAIIKFLNKWEAVILEKHATATIDAMELPESDASILRTVAKNHIAYHSSTKISSSAPIIKPKMLLNISITATKILMDTIGKIVGLQPMNGPVALLFNMQYADEDNKKVTSEDFGDILASNGPRKISLQIVSHAVEATSKKLQAAFRVEAFSDSALSHNKNFIEDAWVTILAQEIADDIIAQVLNTLFDAGTPQEISLQNRDNIVPQIGLNSTEIAKQTRRSMGNWIVVSPVLIPVIEKAFGNEFVPVEQSDNHTPILTLAGTISNRIKVYSYLWKDTSFNKEKLLMGYKGSNIDCPYAYAPYVPVMISNFPQMNPFTFSPEIHIAVRAGQILHDPKAYRSLTITGLVDEPVAETKD